MIEIKIFSVTSELIDFTFTPNSYFALVELSYRAR